MVPDLMWSPSNLELVRERPGPARPEGLITPQYEGTGRGGSECLRPVQDGRVRLPSRQFRIAGSKRAYLSIASQLASRSSARWRLVASMLSGPSQGRVVTMSTPERERYVAALCLIACG